MRPSAHNRADYIQIDGRGIDESGSSFSIPLYAEPEDDSPAGSYGWCATNRNPYDSIVGAILIAVKSHFGASIRLWSDGDLEDEWTHGAMGDGNAPIEIYRNAFPGRALPPILEDPLE